jgi:hypothetical protein
MIIQNIQHGLVNVMEQFSVSRLLQFQGVIMEGLRFKS